MQKIVGQTSAPDAPTPSGAVRGISDRARLEAERRMVGFKPAPPARSEADERREAA